MQYSHLELHSHDQYVDVKDVHGIVSWVHGCLGSCVYVRPPVGSLLGVALEDMVFGTFVLALGD